MCNNLASEMASERHNGLVEFLFISGVPRYKIKIAWAIFGLTFIPAVVAMKVLMMGSLTLQVVRDEF